MKYDPDIGIFGLDVNVVVERPGHRVQEKEACVKQTADATPSL